MESVWRSRSGSPRALQTCSMHSANPAAHDAHMTTVTIPSTERTGEARVRTRSAAMAGALDMLPFIVGYVPFALVIGAAIAEHGSELAGWSGSWLVYGGSAQLAALRSIDDGVLVAVATGLLVNARLVVYSAALGRRWRHQPRWFRLVAAALVIDPTWAAAERYGETTPTARDERKHFLAGGVVLGVGWSAAMAVGVLVGSRIDQVDFEIVVPLCLVALVAPMLRQREHRWVLATAAVTALVTRSWPAGTGMLCAIAVGCLAGSFTGGSRTGRARAGAASTGSSSTGSSSTGSSSKETS
jgi:predicted branched-subunit amino acid permease